MLAQRRFCNILYTIIQNMSSWIDDSVAVPAFYQHYRASVYMPCYGRASRSRR